MLNALAISVPIVAALLALAGTVMAARRTMMAQFAAKAAELALLGEDTTEVINRARLIAQLYENLLPLDFQKRLISLKEKDKKDIGRIVTKAPWTSELWKDVVELLAQQPTDRREQILKDFITVFPDYPELKALQGASQAPVRAE